MQIEAWHEAAFLDSFHRSESNDALGDIVALEAAFFDSFHRSESNDTFGDIVALVQSVAVALAVVKATVRLATRLLLSP